MIFCAFDIIKLIFWRYLGEAGRIVNCAENKYPLVSLNNGIKFYPFQERLDDTFSSFPN
jgi:hypothetical protein